MPWRDILTRDKDERLWVHKCPHSSCDAWFYTRQDYKAHQAQAKHDGPIIWKCGFKECSNVFASRETYIWHMQNIHGQLRERSGVENVRII